MTFPGFAPIGPLPADAPAITDDQRAWIDQRLSIYADAGVRAEMRRELEHEVRTIGAAFAITKLRRDNAEIARLRARQVELAEVRKAS